mgnify:CR=1 FL=1
MISRPTAFEEELVAAYREGRLTKEHDVSPNQTWQDVARALLHRVPEGSTGPALLIVGPDGDRTVHLDGSDVVLGRSTECAILLPYGLVSRRHCQLRQDAGQWIMEDLGSANGILVNGAPCKHRVLIGGDILQVGEATLLFLPARTKAFPELRE